LAPVFIVKPKQSGVAWLRTEKNHENAVKSHFKSSLNDDAEVFKILKDMDFSPDRKSND
jgi:hypothetical protein